MLTAQTEAATQADMEQNPYDLGKHDMIEIIAAFLYERYFLFHRKWHGAADDKTMLIRNIIKDIRDIQATELHINPTEPDQDE